MMYLPTTADGMAAAIGQYIHGEVTRKIAMDEAAAAERAAQPGYVPEPFVWDKKSVPKPRSKDPLGDYCARIRAGGGSREGIRG